MKKNLFSLCCFALSICILLYMFSSCNNTAVDSAKITDDSYLVGWYVDNDMVYMVCRLIIQSDSQKKVNVSAYSDEDEGKLLQKSYLTGYNEDMSSTEFSLNKGRNDVIVVFVGVFGNSEEKNDYNIPDRIELITVDT